ncbi:MAG TPA: hypothetical protein VED45_09590 [Steroidobacteraceae bacterium]|nr:hypothetical protein [Steroidobacteraceae bacterium]
MMGAEGNLPYAAARVHARHGRRLDESAWRRIEASRQLGQYVEVLRAGALAPWVARIEATHDAHAIERALRSEWRAYVRTVASWHPREWQAWLEWWAWLPVLPLLARLARPAAVPAWMLADPVCGPIALGNADERAAAIAATPLAPLAVAVRTDRSMRAAWLRQAERLVPRIDPDTRGHLNTLMSLGAADVATTPPGSTAALVRLFRAASGTAIASGCHLALQLLEFERLRGGLVVRCLFAAATTEAA